VLLPPDQSIKISLAVFMGMSLEAFRKPDWVQQLRDLVVNFKIEIDKSLFELIRSKAVSVSDAAL
jgi:hypothetical protein